MLEAVVTKDPRWHWLEAAWDASENASESIWVGLVVVEEGGRGGVVAVEDLQKPEHEGHELLVVSMFENILTSSSLSTGANQFAPDAEVL